MVSWVPGSVAGMRQGGMRGVFGTWPFGETGGSSGFPLGVPGSVTGGAAAGGDLPRGSGWAGRRLWPARPRSHSSPCCTVVLDKSPNP